MTETLKLSISIVSGITAVVSAIFAWRAVKAAQKTYSMELLSQIYDMYHSDAMLRSVQVVWEVYHTQWQSVTNDAEAEEKTNRGEPIPRDVAAKFVAEHIRAPDSTEWKAIH